MQIWRQQSILVPVSIDDSLEDGKSRFRSCQETVQGHSRISSRACLVVISCDLAFYQLPITLTTGVGVRNVSVQLQTQHVKSRIVGGQ